MKHIRNWKQLFIDIMSGEAVLGAVWLLCYRAGWWILILQALLPVLIRDSGRRRALRKKREIREGFLDLMQSLRTSLQAGYVLENACIQAASELETLYQGKANPILPLVQDLCHGISLHLPIHELFLEFAMEAQDEDIYQFAVIIEIVTRTGGNLVGILKDTMETLRIKTEAEQEIFTMLSGKVYEKNIMLLMPFFVLLYLQAMNPEYVRCFYGNLTGQLLMTLMLLVILACRCWADHLLGQCGP